MKRALPMWMLSVEEAEESDEAEAAEEGMMKPGERVSARAGWVGSEGLLGSLCCSCSVSQAIVLLLPAASPRPTTRNTLLLECGPKLARSARSLIHLAYRVYARPDEDAFEARTSTSSTPLATTKLSLDSELLPTCEAYIQRSILARKMYINKIVHKNELSSNPMRNLRLDREKLVGS